MLEIFSDILIHTAFITTHSSQILPHFWETSRQSVTGTAQGRGFIVFLIFPPSLRETCRQGVTSFRIPPLTGGTNPGILYYHTFPASFYPAEARKAKAKCKPVPQICRILPFFLLVEYFFAQPAAQSFFYDGKHFLLMTNILFYVHDFFSQRYLR